MFLFLSDEQTALQTSVGRLLRTRSAARFDPLPDAPTGPGDDWHELARLGVLEVADPALWEPGVRVPLELAVTQFEIGRHLYPGPFLSSAVAAFALGVTTPSDVATLDRIRTGELTGALGLPPRPGDPPPVLKTLDDGSVVLSGSVLALDAPGAGLLIAAATLDESRVHVAVRLDPSAGTSRLRSLDRRRSIGEIRLDQAPAAVLTGVGGALRPSALDAFIQTLVAAELAGVARDALDRTLVHVRTRTQFGRPLGSLQAVKHRCVDMYAGVESAWSAVLYAGSPWHRSDEEFELAALTAYSTASETAPATVAAAIQLHGAMGFTEELGLHRNLTRAKLLALLLGDPGAHLDTLADRILTLDQGPR